MQSRLRFGQMLLFFASGEVLHKQNSEELERWLENLKPEDFGKSDA